MATAFISLLKAAKKVDFSPFMKKNNLKEVGEDFFSINLMRKLFLSFLKFVKKKICRKFSSNTWIWETSKGLSHSQWGFGIFSLSHPIKQFQLSKPYFEFSAMFFTWQGGFLPSIRIIIFNHPSVEDPFSNAKTSFRSRYMIFLWSECEHRC